MRKFLYLLFIVIVGFTSSDIQREIITIRWDDSVFVKSSDVENDLLRFDGADYSGFGNKIPVYFKNVNVTDNARDFRFVIDNMIFEEIQVSSELPEFKTLACEVEYFTKKLKTGNSSIFQLQLIPLKKENDKIYVLKSFDLKQIPVKLKSSVKIAHSWKNESVLKSGTWKKISTSGKGIYKIPHSRLSEWGFSTPANVKVFGGGGTILAEDPGKINYDDLPQLAVWQGKNNGTDCLFFYAPGDTEWKQNQSTGLFEHDLNDYSTKGYFFLTENTGSAKMVEKINPVTEPSNVAVNTFSAYSFYEDELENILPLGSGKNWYGNKFRSSSIKNITFNISNVENNSDISVKVNAVARSFQSSEMKILLNQMESGTLNFSAVNTGDPNALYASSKSSLLNTKVSGNDLTVTLKYYAGQANNSTDDNAVAWLDYVEVNFRKSIIAGNDPLFFRDLNSVAADNIAEFSIANSTTDTRVFDVTDWSEIKEIPGELISNNFTFVRPANELREYVVFNNNGTFQEPELVGDVSNQNLHALSSPELLIIAHANFISYANQLADFHRSYDGMDVEVVNANQVYNEFSSGIKSATGIRNFIKMFYDRDEKLKYVLLFGDGSFDNKNIRPETENFIPTFQSENSLNPVESFVTDDYFVILDDGESVYNGAVDLGIGRLPVSTTYEAEIVTDKILNYYSTESFGEWRNSVCFIADDGDGGLHLSDSEKLAAMVNDNHPEFITDKIYLDAYPQETTPAGERYPDVTDAINKKVKDGVLVLNYVGHANERFMADEHVLDISNVNSWSNSINLPIFVTATCEFSRFDADDTSIGEYVLLNPNGGGIGLFSTTRVVFAYSNFLLSRSFYNFVFETDDSGNRYRMGDIMRLAKINTINTTNKRNFSLLADPALRLSYPRHKVATTRINGKDAIAETDTLGALQKINIEGSVTDYFGNVLNDFSGEISITVYDKEMVMHTLGNGGANPNSFKVQENIIYKGDVNAVNGTFTYSFVIPKDISYALGEGKIVYYASDGNVDAHGAFDNFVIGGSSGNNIVDNNGPEIDLYLDDTEFKSGDQTGKNPVLLAFLSDENGINTVGTGIGHDITAILDNEYSNVLVLNKYYKSNADDYTSGSISFPLQGLSVGKHTLKLKAWDIANNSTEEEIEFEVTGEFFISQVTNYPNPVESYTYFTFEHNQASEILDIVIEVFDQLGRRVDYLAQEVGSSGNKSNPVRWDFPETQTQLQNGIYVYRITAQNNEGLIASRSGKLLISH